jgi:hypothetical protein
MAAARLSNPESKRLSAQHRHRDVLRHGQQADQDQHRARIAASAAPARGHQNIVDGCAVAPPLAPQGTGMPAAAPGASEPAANTATAKTATAAATKTASSTTAANAAASATTAAATPASATIADNGASETAAASGVKLPPLPAPEPPMTQYWAAYGACMQARGYVVAQ